MWKFWLRPDRWRTTRAARKKPRAVAHHRRAILERLEDRSLLAQLINAGSAADVIYTLPANANTVFLEDDGTGGNGMLQLRSSNGTFDTTVFANPTGSLTINRGNVSDTIQVSAIADFTASLTIGSVGNGFSSVIFAGGITLAVNNSLSANASGTISLPNSASDIAVSGTGTISLTTAKNISLDSGSSIKSVDGGITLSANAASTTAGGFVGVEIINGVVQATGAGAVSVTGKGGDFAGGSQIGVQVRGGGSILGGTSGTLTVNGTGGMNIGGVNYGISVTGAGSFIGSGGANVQLTGQGSGSETSIKNFGVVLDTNGQVTAGGSGTVTVQGRGSDSAGNAQIGVVVALGGTITSNGGNVQIIGQGGGTGASTNNYGVDIEQNGKVTAGSNGTITVQGKGGNSSGGFQTGVLILGSTITSSGGSVQVTGQGGGSGTSANNHGVVVQTSGQVTAGGEGTVIVRGTGGAAFGNSQVGVLISDIGSWVTSSGGNVQIIGQGGGSGSSAKNDGLNVQLGGQVTAGGSGTVTVQGTGGASSGGFQEGVRVSDIGSKITSNGGNVQVTGQGGGSGTSASTSGVNVQLEGVVTAGGSGTVSVQGTGGAGSGNANGGVVVLATAMITSAGGNVWVNGQGGGTDASDGNDGVHLQDAGQVTAGADGTVTVQGTGGTGDLSHGVNVFGAKITSAGGNVQVTGQAGGSSASMVNHGVLVGDSGQVTAGGSGDVSVQGTGGAATGDYQDGVKITGVGARVTSSGGNVQVIGQAGGAGSSAHNSGVNVQSNGQVTAGGSGTVTVQGTGGGGSGDYQIGVRVSDAGSQLTSGGGNVQITGQGGGTGTSANDHGVMVQTSGQVTAGGSGTVTVMGIGGAGSGNTNGGVVVVQGTAKITSSGGYVLVIGRGGGTGDSDGNDGVHVEDTGQVTAEGTGTVAVQGTGGPGDFSLGVNVSGATITSAGGNVHVIGQGGGSEASEGNFGVNVNHAGQLTAGGSGTVTVQGTGGSGSGGSNSGVTVRTSGMITSGGGDVQVTGQGGDAGLSSDNNGVLVTLSSQISAGGAGNINVQGTSGSGTADGNGGIVVNFGGAITTSGGNILATGIEGTGTTGMALSVSQGTIATSATNGTLTLIGNSMYFDGAANISAPSAGTVTLLPATAGRAINLGLAATGATSFDGPGPAPTSPVTVGLATVRSAPSSDAGTLHFTANHLGYDPISRLPLSPRVTINSAIPVDMAVELNLDSSNAAAVATFSDNSDSVDILFDAGINRLGSKGNNVVINLTKGDRQGQGPLVIFGGPNNDTVFVTLDTSFYAGEHYLVHQGTTVGQLIDAINNNVFNRANGIFYASVNGSVDHSVRIDTTAITTIHLAGGRDPSTAQDVIDAINAAFIPAGQPSAGQQVQATLKSGSGDTVVAIQDSAGLGKVYNDVTLVVGDSNVLALSDAELDCITAGTINIGDVNSGPITISGDITRPATTDIGLTAGGAINFTTGSLNTAGGNLSLTPASAGSVGVANPNTEVTVAAGTLSFANSTNLPISINGEPTGQPGEYDQLTVSGNVALMGVNLQLSGVYTPVAGDQFTLVNNTLADGLTIGEFDNLPQDKIFTIANGSFAGNFQITYHGGDGNDVVLTAVNIAPSFDHLAGDYFAGDENPAGYGSAPTVVAGWATNIKAGPANESNQNLTFVVNNDNPDLFAVQPAVDPVSGTLTFTPAPNVEGTAHVTVVLQDDGGGTSPEVSFNIVITKMHRLHNAAEQGERAGRDVTDSNLTGEPDGVISAGDVLAIINYINAKGAGKIPANARGGPPYCDVDADDEVTATDVIVVVNYINAHPDEGEGEFASDSRNSASSFDSTSTEQDNAAALAAAAQPEGLADVIALLAADVSSQQAKRRRI